MKGPALEADKGSRKADVRRPLTDTHFALILVAPAMLVLVGLGVYPLVTSLSDGFFDASLLSTEKRFIGLANLIETVTGPFPRVLGNTLAFSLGSTLLSAAIGLGAALLLNRGIKGQAWLRGIFLFPWVIPGAIGSFIWLWILNANYGVLNGFLRLIGLIDTNIFWFSERWLAMGALIIVKSWNSFPWMMVMFLAGLQGVPRELLESASVDGANSFQRFRNVTVPHLKGVIGVVLLLATIWNFQHFEIIYVLTGGGPAGGTATFSVELYRLAFQRYDTGLAGALGLLWVLCLSGFAFVFLRNAGSEDESDNRKLSESESQA